ncbi:6697_t:CDS:2 [Diversispora eburnea]|uniref:6697_t:CDS:1 n=1 Tax=Diversispora eburnea TaxID=1213867 RepID=A0A9N9C460_9GLOM|nr:6697_t:CDS:2 [Diversispora eburnea]
MNHIIVPSCFNDGCDSADDLRNEEFEDIILIDWVSATIAFASEEEPGTVTGTAAFMNKTLMVLAEGIIKIERAPVDDLVSLAYTLLWMWPMISLLDNDGVGLFVAWARSLNRMVTVNEINYNEGKRRASDD